MQRSALQHVRFSVALMLHSTGDTRAQIPERYQLIDLADVRPLRGTRSTAEAVSNSGHAAGSYTDASGRLRAVIWERTAESAWIASEAALTSAWTEASRSIPK
jgi:hypothetical protein